MTLYICSWGKKLNKMLFSYREKMSLLKTITKCCLGEKRFSLSIKVHTKICIKTETYQKMDRFITILNLYIHNQSVEAFEMMSGLTKGEH